jgi:hypothetical protein
MGNRLGKFTRAIAYREATPGSDAGITAGLVLQHRGDQEAKYVTKRTTSAVPLAKGNLRPDDQAYDPFDCSGPLNMWLDYRTAPFLVRGPFGATGYERIPLAVGSLHRMFIPSGVFIYDSFQIQYEYLQAAAKYWRERYSVIKSIGISHVGKGGVPMDVSFVGIGDPQQTDLAGTKTDNVYVATTSFNGTVIMTFGGVQYVVSGLRDFKWMLDTGAVAEPVVLNAGKSAPPSVDAINASFDMSFLWNAGSAGPDGDFILTNLAAAQTLLAMDVLYASLPTPTATEWMRILQPNNVVTGDPSGVGGKGGKVISASVKMVDRGATIAAEAWGTTIGPYAITLGVNDKFSVKIDGGGTVTTTLTAGAARTSTQVVADLMANGTFTAVALADVFNGRVRVTSKQISVSGSASSVQFDTGVANNCAATLGFVSTAINGKTSPLMIEFYNSSNADV